MTTPNDHTTGFRVIATDLDRTLLGDGGRITARSLAALTAARERGVATVAVTSRPHRAFEVWTWGRDVFDAVVCAGGACVYEPRSDQVTVEHVLDAAVAARVAARLRSIVPGLQFAVETGWDIVAEPAFAKRDSVIDRRRTCSSLEEVFLVADPCLKLIAHLVGGRADDLERVASTLDLEGVRLHHSGSRDQIEFGPADVDKASGLAAWCRRRGFGSEDVVAFGDAPADASMLAWAGRSYAVAHAHPAAAAAATHRCGSNAADGVAATIETLLASPPTAALRDQSAS